MGEGEGDALHPSTEAGAADDLLPIRVNDLGARYLQEGHGEGQITGIGFKLPRIGVSYTHHGPAGGIHRVEAECSLDPLLIMAIECPTFIFRAQQPAACAASLPTPSRATSWPL